MTDHEARGEKSLQGDKPEAQPPRRLSIEEARALERGTGKSFAALFRIAFEDALREAEAGISTEPVPQTPKPLAYYGPGKPVIIEAAGHKRYLYNDGTIDRKSIVSPAAEERAYEVGGIATNVELVKDTGTNQDKVRVLNGQNGAGANGNSNGALDPEVVHRAELPLPAGVVLGQE